MSDTAHISPSVEAARLRMASLCATREMCEFEIRAKLLRLGMDDEQVEQVLDHLVRMCFVDDARYARAFAADKARFAGWGRRKIAMALRAKRIDQRHVDAALKHIDTGDYAERLLKVARQKASSLDLNEYADRMKLARRLASRGFEGALITSAIELLRREQSHES